jgi:hypothetical protein
MTRDFIENYIVEKYRDYKECIFNLRNKKITYFTQKKSFILNFMDKKQGDYSEISLENQNCDIIGKFKSDSSNIKLNIIHER